MILDKLNNLVEVKPINLKKGDRTIIIKWSDINIITGIPFLCLSKGIKWANQ
jgi:hypothetical protein